ncbi:MAG: hypothetical protein GC206_11910 [Alphaproteobacteria bacterium]|nr:hypothetical protein [Alphaproteobacteria bacterium]
MYYAYSLPEDPTARAIAARPIESVFFSEFMRSPWRSEVALFEGDCAGTHEHLVLLVAPSLDHVPQTKRLCPWHALEELPDARWSLTVGRADAWDQFSVPRSGHALL